jgi:hypothetical protein
MLGGTAHIVKSEDISKELWSLANIITGFSVVQSVAIAIAFGKDLAGLQKEEEVVKVALAVIAVVFAGVYCFAVRRCWALARSIDSEHEIIWRQVTRGRELCIWLFTGVLIFGLFAPEIFHPCPLTRRCSQPLAAPMSHSP